MPILDQLHVSRASTTGLLPSQFLFSSGQEGGEEEATTSAGHPRHTR